MEVAGQNRLCYIAYKAIAITIQFSGGGIRNCTQCLGADHDQYLLSGGDQDPEGKSRWEKATIAFTFLKRKIANTPILNYFDPDRPPLNVDYASKWAVSAALL